MVLKSIYTLFIGVLVALFIGLGIAAFYVQPKMPEYPASLKYSTPIGSPQNASVSADFQQNQEKYDNQLKDFDNKSQVYNRTVSVIALAAAILILILSLTLVKNLYLISDGLLLGGVFTLLYSIVRGFNSNDDKFRFVVVSIGLIVSLVLGYIKFIRTAEKK